MESHLNQGTDQEYDVEEEDFIDYNQAELDQDYEEEQEPPKAESKPKAPLKSAPSPMNFTDLLRLAEKKQFEPVEIKVVKKAEDRPLTAEELREREFLERKHRKKKPEPDAKLPPPVLKRRPLIKTSWVQSPAEVLGTGSLLPKDCPFLKLRRNSDPARPVRNKQLCLHPNPCQARGPR